MRIKGPKLDKKKIFFFNTINEANAKPGNLKNYEHLRPLGVLLKRRKFFKSYWNHNTFFDDYYSTLKKNYISINNTKKSLNNKFFKHFDSFCLLTLTRFYCHIGEQKNKLNNFWRGYILGSYNNITIINLNISLVIFKLILSIFSKVFYKFFEVSRALIFSNKVKKNLIFRLGGKFDNHYYFSKWVFGLLTNKTLRYKKKKVFKKKKPRIFLKSGGFPVLGFFTDFELNSQREFILGEFNKFSIPTFTISDVAAGKSYETYTCPLNAKNIFSIQFYLLTIARLILKNKLLKNLFWLWNLNNILIKIFFIRKVRNRFKRRKRQWRLKPFYSWNHSKLVREHYKAVDDFKEKFSSFFY